MICWVFELKLHKNILGTPETYISSCKKGPNRSPLKQKHFIN